MRARFIREDHDSGVRIVFDKDAVHWRGPFKIILTI